MVTPPRRHRYGERRRSPTQPAEFGSSRERFKHESFRFLLTAPCLKIINLEWSAPAKELMRSVDQIMLNFDNRFAARTWRKLESVACDSSSKMANISIDSVAIVSPLPITVPNEFYGRPVTPCSAPYPFRAIRRRMQGGFAWRYPRYDKSGECTAAEANAREHQGDCGRSESGATL